MKILQIISGRTINGALTYCKFVSEHLQSLGHEITVVGREDGWLNGELDPAIPYIVSELKRSPFELKRIAKLVREKNIDVIHTHMSRGHAFGVILRIMTGVPVVATAHAHSFQVHWKLNDFVIANSQSTFDYQRRVNRVSKQKMDKVFCFTDLERFKHVTPLDLTIVRRQLRLDGDEFLVGMVGDFVARKGHRYLFDALPRIIEAVPNFKLVLLGRFNREEPIVKKLRSLQLKEKMYRRVKWLGVRTNVQDFMAAFDLCVVPSIVEPLGLVALESLAAGTPVVAATTGGLPEIVENNKSGILVPPKNSTELADAIIRMAHSPAERERMGEYGRQMVNQRFDPIELTHQVERILQKVVSSRHAA